MPTQDSAQGGMGFIANHRFGCFPHYLVEFHPSSPAHRGPTECRWNSERASGKRKNEHPKDRVQVVIIYRLRVAGSAETKCRQRCPAGADRDAEQRSQATPAGRARSGPQETSTTRALLAHGAPAHPPAHHVPSRCARLMQSLGVYVADGSMFV